MCCIAFILILTHRNLSPHDELMMIAYFSNNSYIKIQIIKEIILKVDLLLKMYTWSLKIIQNARNEIIFRKKKKNIHGMKEFDINL